MSTVSHRTEKDVTRFIQQHHNNGKLQMSLVEIGENTGYSNATIYRTLKKLEEAGVIKVIPSSVPTKPNTILYDGNSEMFAQNSMTPIIKMSHDILLSAKELFKECQEVADKIIQLEKEYNELMVTEKNTVFVHDLPDGIHKIILVKK